MADYEEFDPELATSKIDLHRDTQADSTRTASVSSNVTPKEKQRSTEDTSKLFDDHRNEIASSLISNAAEHFKKKWYEKLFCNFK